MQLFPSKLFSYMHDPIETELQAAYLQKAGLNVLVLERRHIIGGAAVTEEIFPGNGRPTPLFLNCERFWVFLYHFVSFAFQYKNL